IIDKSSIHPSSAVGRRSSAAWLMLFAWLLLLNGTFLVFFTSFSANQLLVYQRKINSMQDVLSLNMILLASEKHRFFQFIRDAPSGSFLAQVNAITQACTDACGVFAFDASSRSMAALLQFRSSQVHALLGYDVALRFFCR